MSPTLAELLPSWELSLQAGHKSPGTIRSYLDSVRGLSAFLIDEGMRADVDGVGADDIRAFLAHTLEVSSPGNAHKHFRNLRVFFGWLVAEGERAGGTPLAEVEPPKVDRKPVRPLSEEELARLLAVCAGDSWIDRRDTAIMRILMDNGMRVSALAGLRYSATDPDANDVWLARHVLRITLPGGEGYLAPLGRKSAAAVDRYLRARTRLKHASSPWLWLPERGVTAHGGDRRLTAAGIQQMLHRRGEEAGIPGVFPHRFRHTMASGYLREGGDPLNLMRVGGWKTPATVRQYVELALAEHARLSPGDRI
ncbi:tyrosine-type recombinase/integrase [Acrocarpospora corrugata]|uniref:tyrosine-type recombinase/integrase n=1 Tax=Acrocarpospora corrugata TaxID=35763 RepID=UPI00147879CD|nr:tyrosine-type recombinase/integrase [Acrocarpospora corrugata]